MTLAPTLETERLILREYRLSDFDAYAEMFATERAKYIGGPKKRRDAWFDFASEAGLWSLRGYGTWAIETRDTGTLAGWAGIYHPDHNTQPELGWMLLEDFEGQGYAREAAAAIRSYASETFNLSGLASFIAIENTRSIRLAEALGATHVERREGVLGAYHVYRHPIQEAK